MKPVAQTPGGPPEKISSVNPMSRTANGGIKSGRTKPQKYTAVIANSGAGKMPPLSDTGRLAERTSNTADKQGRIEPTVREMPKERGSATAIAPHAEAGWSKPQRW